LAVGFYDKVLVHDRKTKQIFFCVSDPSKKGRGHLDSLMVELKAWFSQLSGTLKDAVETDSFEALSLCSNFTREEYCRAVSKVLEHIHDGDIYQANLSQAFEFSFEGSPRKLFDLLRRATPVPFGAYLDMGHRQVLSVSPERLVSLRAKVLETRPIKGTRPRGGSASEDERLRDELLLSEKDRAELTMIVDLERNDLGRVSEFGSVSVEKFPILESYENVHHLVGQVRSRLAHGSSAVDVVKALFPGGSITGAPKIRAMQIIDTLEPTHRSLYTGSLGYLGFDGNMDLNILIRTVTLENQIGRFQVGGGIVADSKPENEFEETLHKAKGILKALNMKGEVIYG